MTNCRLEAGASRTSVTPNSDGTYRFPEKFRAGMQILLGKVGYSSEIYHASRLHGL